MICACTCWTRHVILKNGETENGLQYRTEFLTDSIEVTWNLFLTTSRGWQTALAHVPAAKPQRNNWKLETLSSGGIEPEWEDLDLFHAYNIKNIDTNVIGEK